MQKILISVAALAVVASSHAFVWGFAAPIIDGSQEVVQVTTPAYGTGSFTVDDSTFEVAGSVTLFNIGPRLTAGHIHRAPVGVNGPVIFDLLGNEIGRINSGNMTVIAFRGTLTGGATQLAQMVAGNTYFNFHTAAFPGGEIRGQIDCVKAVPEPGTMAALAMGGLALLARKRRK